MLPKSLEKNLTETGSFLNGATSGLNWTQLDSIGLSWTRVDRLGLKGLKIREILKKRRLISEVL